MTSQTTDVALADVDGDGDLDIIVPGRSGAGSLIFFNDGKAGFAESRPFGATADDATSVAVGDLDGDGDIDMVVGQWEQPHSVFLNDGRGRFTRHASFGTGREQTWTVALADLALDGDLDVVVGNANTRRDEPSRLCLNDDAPTSRLD